MTSPASPQRPRATSRKACNTASSVAIAELRAAYDLPIIGVIEPGALAAVSSTLKGKIGVIGTEGTITSHAYRREIARLDRDVELLERSCPLFVPLAEEGWTDREVTLVIAHEYLTPLRDAGVEVAESPATIGEKLANVL